MLDMSDVPSRPLILGRRSLHEPLHGSSQLFVTALGKGLYDSQVVVFSLTQDNFKYLTCSSFTLLLFSFPKLTCWSWWISPGFPRISYSSRSHLKAEPVSARPIDRLVRLCIPLSILYLRSLTPVKSWIASGSEYRVLWMSKPSNRKFGWRRISFW